MKPLDTGLIRIATAAALLILAGQAIVGLGVLSGPDSPPVLVGMWTVIAGVLTAGAAVLRACLGPRSQP